MKDIAKGTVEELITFIYLGKVDVKHENLEDFLNAAKALDIKGLTDKGCAQTSNVQPSISNCHTPAYNAEQYQSTRTVRVPSPTKINQDQQPTNAFDQQKPNSDFEDTDEMNQCGYYADIDDYYYGSDTGHLDPSLDQEYGMEGDPWNVKFGAEKNGNGSAVQRSQQDANPMAMDGEFNVPEGPWNFDDNTLNAAEATPVKRNVLKPKRARLEFGESNISSCCHISCLKYLKDNSSTDCLNTFQIP